VSVADRRATRPLPIVLVVALLVSAGCALAGGTLGGREKCWPESERRAPSVWRGILEIDASGARLATPEGDDIPLLPGELAPGIADDGMPALVHGSDVAARAGEDVTLFGGAGADGALVVCGVEEIHQGT
jgi:hypothetical protein